MMRPAVEPLALAQRLKSATAVMHRRVERSAFMARLLRGEIDRATYVGLLLNLHALYDALESVLLRHAAQPAVAPIVLPELFRRQALDADLAVLAAPLETPLLPLANATLQYVRRLNDLDTSQPALLVAHAYVRYLGDLNGGQALRRVVKRALGLQGDAGTSFYDFGNSASCHLLAQRFRAGLETVAVVATESDAIVSEAVSAFERHEQLFDELASGA